jgi:hypothetical protein
MAHVHTFGVVAPAAAGIIQFVSSIYPPGAISDPPPPYACSLGATSCYVTESVPICHSLYNSVHIN